MTLQEILNDFLHMQKPSEEAISELQRHANNEADMIAAKSYLDMTDKQIADMVRYCAAKLKSTSVEGFKGVYTTSASFYFVVF